MYTLLDIPFRRFTPCLHMLVSISQLIIYTSVFSLFYLIFTSTGAFVQHSANDSMCDFVYIISELQNRLKFITLVYQFENIINPLIILETLVKKTSLILEVFKLILCPQFVENKEVVYNDITLH